MKTLVLVLCIALFSINSFASNSGVEPQENLSVQETEFHNVLNNVLNKELALAINRISEKCKVIIIDCNFKTIREENLEKIEDICNQSTLVPIIYRSEFITKINHVSYFMLQKK